jgi:2-dehydro-3-deoxyphosphogluconate aldolase / (4S)-4-hydroxy-2-oxoglutarate aldolase
MSTFSWLPLVKQHRAIAVIRAPQLDIGCSMARAIAPVMPLIEITWNSDQPVKLVERLRSQLPNCVIGAGTLLTVRDVQEAIAAGAQFLFSPHVNLAMIQAAIQQDVPIIPGALTPTEIVTAWQAGASSIKVFPAQSVGGAEYIRALQAPLGYIPLIPTGGVTLENAKDYLGAGAIAVGLAGELFPKGAIASQNWREITHQAERLMASLKPFCSLVHEV